MKQPKKLTYHQKEKLTRKGFDANKYMLLSEDKDTFTVISKEPNEYGNKDQMTFSK